MECGLEINSTYVNASQFEKTKIPIGSRYEM